MIIEKNYKKGGKGQKGAKNADLRLFLTFFFIFGPFLLILNQKKIQNFKNICLKI